MVKDKTLQEISVIRKEREHKPTIILDPKVSGDYKNANDLSLPIGKYIQSFFRHASTNHLLTTEIIKNLCDYRYCKGKFNINFSVLIELKDIRDKDILMKDQHDRNRYYKEIYRFNGKDYLLCSQWYEHQLSNFSKW